MKKIIIGMLLLSACAATTERGARLPELTMEHLGGIEICASQINFNHNSETSEVTKALAMWYEEVLKLDNSCARTADFNLKKAYVNTTKKNGMVIYEEVISAELVVTSINGKEARSSATVGNKLSFDVDSTLAEKEQYLFNINEKTILDFDKVMRESINKYIK